MPIMAKDKKSTPKLDMRSYLFDVSVKDLDKKIDLEHKRLAYKHQVTRVYTLLFAFTLAISGLFMIFALISDESIDPQTISTFLPMVLGAVSAYVLGQKFNRISKDKIEDLSTEKTIKEKIVEVHKSDMTAYLDELVSLNLTNLALYYKQVERHTNKSFWSGLIAAIMAFLLLVTGTAMALVTEDNYLSSALVSASGLLSGFISSIFFSLYNRTVIQMKKYHDNLIQAQNTLLAFRVLDSIKNDDSRDKTIHMMAEELVKPINANKV